MKLIDLVRQIKDIDEELIIFQEDVGDINSDIELAHEDDVPNGVLSLNGKEYRYLIEVFLASEFMTDYINSFAIQPSIEDVTKRLYEYILNDA